MNNATRKSVTAAGDTNNLSATQRQVLSWIHNRTHGHGRFYLLAGARNAEFRRELILKLTGEAKRPLAKCGVAHLTEIIHSLAPAGTLDNATCDADRDDKLAAWLDTL